MLWSGEVPEDGPEGDAVLRGGIPKRNLMVGIAHQYVSKYSWIVAMELFQCQPRTRHLVSSTVVRSVLGGLGMRLAPWLSPWLNSSDSC